MILKAEWIQKILYRIYMMENIHQIYPLETLTATKILKTVIKKLPAMVLAE